MKYLIVILLLCGVAYLHSEDGQLKLKRVEYELNNDAAIWLGFSQ